MTVQTTSRELEGVGDASPATARLRAMLLIRKFEQEMQRLFLKGEVHGTTHLYNGQEAVSVGVAEALDERDWVAATYRGHGAALARGIPVERVAAELLGRTTGVNGGRGGSMNLIDLEHGLVGCFGIVGGSIAAATGAAMTAKARGDGGVAVAFFGDGAANQGYFHECLNLAAVRRLPVVFVCENNLYGEYTPMHAVTAGADIAARAAGYAMPAEKVDGNAVDEVATVAARAVENARSGNGPMLLEALTYRQLGHSKSDPAKYRSQEETDAWLARDPIVLERARLVTDLDVRQESLDELEAQVDDVIAEAIATALAAPAPDPDDAAVTEYAP